MGFVASEPKVDIATPAAIAHVLHLSGAGEVFDKISDEFDEGGVGVLSQGPRCSRFGEECKALCGPGTELYFAKEGRVEYVLDFLEAFTRDQSPLGDATWDETMEELVAEGKGEDWGEFAKVREQLEF